MSADGSTSELKLRELLWLRHGCSYPALYGDDGNMQCSKCRIDFKKDSAEEIGRRFVAMAMRKLDADVVTVSGLGTIEILGDDPYCQSFIMERGKKVYCAKLLGHSDEDHDYLRAQ